MSQPGYHIGKKGREVRVLGVLQGLRGWDLRAKRARRTIDQFWQCVAFFASFLRHIYQPTYNGVIYRKIGRKGALISAWKGDLSGQDSDGGGQDSDGGPPTFLTSLTRARSADGAGRDPLGSFPLPSPPPHPPLPTPLVLPSHTFPDNHTMHPVPKVILSIGIPLIIGYGVMEGTTSIMLPRGGAGGSSDAGEGGDGASDRKRALRPHPDAVPAASLVRAMKKYVDKDKA